MNIQFCFCQSKNISHLIKLRFAISTEKNIAKLHQTGSIFELRDSLSLSLSLSPLLHLQTIHTLSFDVQYATLFKWFHLIYILKNQVLVKLIIVSGVLILSNIYCDILQYCGACGACSFFNLFKVFQLKCFPFFLTYKYDIPNYAAKVNHVYFSRIFSQNNIWFIPCPYCILFFWERNHIIKSY